MESGESFMAFDYALAEFIPFRDRDVLERVRGITREQITDHPKADFEIRVLDDSDGVLLEDGGRPRVTDRACA